MKILQVSSHSADVIRSIKLQELEVLYILEDFEDDPLGTKTQLRLVIEALNYVICELSFF